MSIESIHREGRKTQYATISEMDQQ
jgi:hypothetical protein